MTDRNFKSAAELLAKYQEETGVALRAPVNVDELASFLNVRVEDDLNLELEDAIGQICFNDGNQAVVSINPVQNSYEPRRRFTLAHELGHFCLHTDKVKSGFKDNRKTMSRSLSYWDPKESEANNFAAQLLMPSELILSHGQEILDEYKVSFKGVAMPAAEFTARLASLFKVSNKAMEYRLKNLGIIK